MKLRSGVQSLRRIVRIKLGILVVLVVLAVGEARSGTGIIVCSTE